MFKIYVRRLDVWGHSPGDKDCDCGLNDNDEPKCIDSEGFTVNDVYDGGSIEVDDTEDDTIEAALIEHGYLHKLDKNSISIHGDVSHERAVVEHIEENGKPLYFLDIEEDI